MATEFLTDVVVPKEKILDYLLNAQHEEGAAKADFFLALGFTRDLWGAFGEALRNVAVSNPVAKSLETKHGIKYVVEGRLTAPTGASPHVRTVWIVDAGQTAAR